jgi:hypothetical protein
VDWAIADDLRTSAVAAAEHNCSCNRVAAGGAAAEPACVKLVVPAAEEVVHNTLRQQVAGRKQVAAAVEVEADTPVAEVVEAVAEVAADTRLHIRSVHTGPGLVVALHTDQGLHQHSWSDWHCVPTCYCLASKDCRGQTSWRLSYSVSEPMERGRQLQTDRVEGLVSEWVGMEFAQGQEWEQSFHLGRVQVQAQERVWPTSLHLQQSYSRAEVPEHHLHSHDHS